MHPQDRVVVIGRGICNVTEFETILSYNKSARYFKDLKMLLIPETDFFQIVCLNNIKTLTRKINSHLQNSSNLT